ncbi:MAG: hypothetical protein GY852_05000 [bacterium]|nr:hypothetical protein [bacterium]
MIEVFKGNHSEEVTSDYYVKAKNVVIEAMTGLTINVGGNFITIDSSGVTIKGTKVNINSGGSALSGSPGSLVAPTAPLEAVISGESVAGKVSAAGEAPATVTEKMSPPLALAHNAPTHKEPTEEEAAEKSWIEIELLGEDDKPITGEKYVVTLPDGKTVASGTTGSKGTAKVPGIDPGKCKVTFPNLDKEAWEKK